MTPHTSIAASIQAIDISTFHFSPIITPIVGIALVIINVALAIACIVLAWYTIPGKREVATPANHYMVTDASRMDWARRALGFILLACMASGPSIIVESNTRAVQTTDVLIAVDTTGSMAVHDAQYGSSETYSRLQVAQRVVKDTLGMFNNASYAAIQVGAKGTVAVPLTPDRLAIANWASTLRPEPTTASSGSSLDKALDGLIPAARDTRKAHPNDTIVVIWITDGEQTSTTTRRSFASLRSTVNHAYVVGVGSEQGAQVPQVDTNGTIHTDSPVLDPSTGQPGISKMDITNLEAMADEMSGSVCITSQSRTFASSGNNDVHTTLAKWRIEDQARPISRSQLVIEPIVVAFAALLLWETIVWVRRSRRML